MPPKATTIKRTQMALSKHMFITPSLVPSQTPVTPMPTDLTKETEPNKRPPRAAETAPQKQRRTTTNEYEAEKEEPSGHTL